MKLITLLLTFFCIIQGITLYGHISSQAYQTWLTTYSQASYEHEIENALHSLILLEGGSRYDKDFPYTFAKAAAHSRFFRPRDFDLPSITSKKIARLFSDLMSLAKLDRDTKAITSETEADIKKIEHAYNAAMNAVTLNDAVPAYINFKLIYQAVLTPAYITPSSITSSTELVQRERLKTECKIKEDNLRIYFFNLIFTYVSSGTAPLRVQLLDSYMEEKSYRLIHTQLAQLDFWTATVIHYLEMASLENKEVYESSLKIFEEIKDNIERINVAKSTAKIKAVKKALIATVSTIVMNFSYYWKYHQEYLQAQAFLKKIEHSWQKSSSGVDPEYFAFNGLKAFINLNEILDDSVSYSDHPLNLAAPKMKEQANLHIKELGEALFKYAEKDAQTIYSEFQKKEYVNMATFEQRLMSFYSKIMLLQKINDPISEKRVDGILQNLKNFLTSALGQFFVSNEKAILYFYTSEAEQKIINSEKSSATEKIKALKQALRQTLLQASMTSSFKLSNVNQNLRLIMEDAQKINTDESSTIAGLIGLILEAIKPLKPVT